MHPFLFFPPYPLFHILSILTYRSLLYNIVYIPPYNFCLGKTLKLGFCILDTYKLLLRQNKIGQNLLRQIDRIKQLISSVFYNFA